jgi:hypothetical protein
LRTRRATESLDRLWQINRGRQLAGIDVLDADAVEASAVTEIACLGIPRPSPATRAADTTLATSTKSANTAGGVICLGGRGPFQAFIFIGGLGRRKTGVEDDAGLPPS